MRLTSTRLASERLDVLEDEVPRSTCAVSGCRHEGRYEMPGKWRTFFVCARHRPGYRQHFQILRRIRSL